MSGRLRARYETEMHAAPLLVALRASRLQGVSRAILPSLRIGRSAAGANVDERANADELMEQKFGDLTVQINRGQCIASSNCIKLAPEVFELDEEKIVSFKQDAPEIERERLIEACDICPVDALVITDSGGNKLVPR